MEKPNVIFVFLDGFGLGASEEYNPIFTTKMSFILSVLKAPLVEGLNVERSNLLVKPLDACLGVEGLPQSATGQTALLTGINAAKELGYHLPAFPNEFLVGIIRQHSVLKQLNDHGFRATFANCYTSQYFELVQQGRRSHSVTTHCVLASDAHFRTLEDLQKGEGVYWSITNEYLPEETGFPIERISPFTAGTRLTHIAKSFDFVLYESFLSDLIGHSASVTKAASCLSILDGFFRGICTTMQPTTTLIVSSDHGNIEDTRTGTHTTNPVPLLALGPHAEEFMSAKSITDIVPNVVRVFLD